jgi:hypothetical protein
VLCICCDNFIILCYSHRLSIFFLCAAVLLAAGQYILINLLQELWADCLPGTWVLQHPDLEASKHPNSPPCECFNKLGNAEVQFEDSRHLFAQSSTIFRLRS